MRGTRNQSSLLNFVLINYPMITSKSNFKGTSQRGRLINNTQMVNKKQKNPKNKKNKVKEYDWYEIKQLRKIKQIDLVLQNMDQQSNQAMTSKSSNQIGPT